MGQMAKRIRRRSLLAVGATAPIVALTPAAQRLFAEPLSSGTRFREETTRSRETADKGYRWLNTAFNRDGGTSIDIANGQSDISCTALVGMSLLSRGSNSFEGRDRRLIWGITKYLCDVVRRDRFVVNLGSQVRADLCAYADHHFAALYLSQVLGQDTTRASEFARVKRCLMKLVAQIGKAQHPTGHWGPGRYPQLAAVAGWSSLFGAYHAGLKVKASADKTAKYLINFLKHHTRLNPQNLFPFASGIRVLYSRGDDDPLVVKALDRVIVSLNQEFRTFRRFGGEQYYAFHVLNETMLQYGGRMWRQWYPAVRDKLCDVQNKDGSWTGYSCITSRTFCTALL